MQIQKPSIQVKDIREVFTYAQRFAGGRFVIQISSGLIEHHLFHSLVQDIASLHQNSIQVLLVPSAGKKIDAVLKQFGHKNTVQNGLRISAEESLPLIMMAAFDIANRLMTALSSHKLDAVIGNWVKARAVGVVDGIDFQMTGRVDRIQKHQLENILQDGIIPILPCIGWNALGQAYNISSLELARFLATSFSAEKLFFLCEDFFLDASKLSVGDNSIIHNNQITGITAEYCDEFLQANAKSISPTIYELIQHSAEAALQGVKRVHILNGTIDGAILQEIFTAEGCGTMIHHNPVQSIRPMEPTDLNAVRSLIEPEIQKGNLLRRYDKELLQHTDNFVVYVSDGNIRACAALYCYDSGEAELASLVVNPYYSNMGIGKRLLNYLCEGAREKNINKIFALTTNASDWFLSMGFQRANPSDLPAKRAYSSDRNSRVYCMHL